MASSQRNNDEFMSDINMTPLVDVMLVLLIVMMVTASFTVSKSLQVSLPKATSGIAETVPTTLSITALGRWFVDGAEVTDVELAQRLRQLQATTPEVHVIVAADAHTPHQEVVRAMDFLRARDVTRLSIGVTPAGL